MPNRIIKESICRSDNLDRLSADEECFFYRLMVQCDDFGRYDGRAPIIKGACFPLKDRITTNKVEKMLDSLIRESLVFIYSVDGLPYIQMTKWGKHQQIRAKRSKYPEPNTDTEIVQSSDINGNQLKSDDVTCPRNPIQSNPNPIRIQSNDDYSETDSIIDRLNEKAKSEFKHSNSSRKHIAARLAESFTADDCKLVIDFKVSDWLGNPEMEKYLTPETLFRPTKFENNLNAAKRWASSGRPSTKPSDNGNSSPRRVVTRPGEYNDVFESCKEES